MRAIFGLLLIMLSLAMAVVWMPDDDGQRQLAVVTEIARQELPRQGNLPANSDRGARTFSPHTPLLATVEPADGRRPAHSASLARIVGPVTTTIAPRPGYGGAAPAGPAQPLAAASVVTGSVAAMTTASAPAPSAAERLPDAAVAAKWGPVASTMSRDELVRNLQRELRRVGCYNGEVDGSWGAGSRRAMSAFTDRVNASLPVDQPDIILLTLLKGQSLNACSKDCPAGQSMSNAGRCLPNAVVARANVGNDRRSAMRGRELTVTPAAVAAQGGTVATMTVTAPRWTTDVQRVGGVSSTSTTPALTASPIVTPLPGRMAMGGPQAGSGAYIATPADHLPARDAVRAAADREYTADDMEAAARQAAAPPRTRARRTASSRRAPAYDGYRYPPDFAFRPSRPIVAPRYYAAAPRRSSRSWTGSFFANQ